MEHSQYAALADMSASAQPPPPSSIQASVLPLVGSYSSNSTMDDVINSSGEYVNVPPSGSSYMTIGGAGMMATSMMGNNMSTAQQHNAATLLSCSSTSSSSAGSMQPSNCSTTTFKTPLLPMPTLEDIEVGLQTTQQPQQMMPAGILKYPVCSNASNIMAMPPPMGIGPGPPQTTLPPPSALSPTTTAILYEQQQPMQQQQQHQQHQTLMTMSSAPPPPLPTCSSAATLLDSSTCGTLKSSAKLQTPANLQATATTNGTSATANSQIVLNLGVTGGVAVLNNCNPQTSTTITSSSSSSTVVPLNLQQQQQQLLSTTTANSSKTSSRSNLHNRPASPKCCACFGGVGGGGGGGRGNNSSSSYNNVRNSTTKSCLSTKSANSSKKGRRRSHHSSQTFWSAVLTNLGICALLLAYTLLGSFIFLTIESDEATFLQQQRTLASTKRNISPNSNKQYPAAATTTTTTTNHNNLYQIQQQQQQQLLQQYMSTQHMDNSSMSSSSSGSYGAHQTASSSSSTLSHLPEGGVISFNNNNNDFGYGDVEYPSQYPDSTYDVRQRTIENIWDITVSLNILYKENWTKLAALEIAKFQDQLIKRLNEDAMLQLTPLDAANSNPGLADGTSTSTNGQSPATEAVLLYHHHQHGLMPHHLHYHHHHEWNFAKAFLYSLTVLTTIGYGNIAPRTTLGRMVTLAYAFFGIPLTLVYLSSTGGILAKVARDIFSKALCCCLCSNCGYCCYDEKRMAEKERRMKRKRQQEELRKQQAAMQEPYYVRSGSMADSFHTPEKQSLAGNTIQIPDLDSLSASESRGSMHGLAILAPILLCFSMMIIYILFGAVVLYRLEEWPLLDGIYFCFMSLSTIGFGDMMPGFRHDSNTTIWFCSIYIMSGMALTAMCFNVIHEEIVNRLKIVVEFKKDNPLDTTQDDTGFYMPP